MARYQGDPRWIEARFPGKCCGKDCAQAINPGDKVFYYPNSRSIFARTCGHGDAASCDFMSAKFDEDGF